MAVLSAMIDNEWQQCNFTPSATPAPLNRWLRDQKASPPSTPIREGTEKPYREGNNNKGKAKP